MGLGERCHYLTCTLTDGLDTPWPPITTLLPLLALTVVSVCSHDSDRNTPNECRNAVRPPPTTSWHTVFSFNNSSNTFLRTIPKGAHVYVEAGYELRDADPDAEAGSPNAQRQVFLRHGAYLRYFSNAPAAQTIGPSENIRVLKYPSDHRGEEEHLS